MFVMRKLLFLFSFMYLLTGAYSQRLDDLLSAEAKKKNSVVLKQIDSLQKIISKLKKQELADAYIDLSSKFLLLPVSRQVKFDSTYKYLGLALTESKNINYKRGLGLVYSKLSGVGIFKYDMYLEKNKERDNARLMEFLDESEDMLKKAIDIGEKTNNNMILGGSYWNLAGVVE